MLLPPLAGATKLNPHLRMLRGRARAAALRPGAREPVHRVLILTVPGVAIDDLRRSYPKARFRSQAGPVVTANVPDSVLDVLDADPRVVRIDAARKLHKTLDIARQNLVTGGGLLYGTTRNGVSDLAGATGAGVIVGIVDTGIDYHHADFKDPSTGHSRILYLWDQTVSGTPPNFFGFSCTPYATSTETFNCGTEWSQALLNSGSSSEIDADGHGTHVAGIAAGNGRAGSSPGAYVGFAPKADIIFVKTGFYNDEIIDGVDYIAARANLLSERAVINLSLGGQIDPHDGTSPFDQAIAAVAASTPVVVAMGNDGTGVGGYPHASQGGMTNGQSVTFNVSVGSYLAGVLGTDAAIDFWTGGPSSASNAAYTVKVAIGGTTCGTETDGNGTDTATTSNPFTACSGLNVYLDNDNSYVGQPGGDTTTSNDREVYVDVNSAGGLSAMTVNVTFTCTSATCPPLDGFVDPEGEDAIFSAGAGYTTPSTLTLGSPATANGVFGVAAYSSKATWSAAGCPGGVCNYGDGETLGVLSTFSAQGPTRDGRQKPEVAAPGDVIASSLSAQAIVCNGSNGSTCGSFTDIPGTFNQLLGDGAHAILAGTSMAAPVVTGIIATRLQGNPGRGVSDLRSILETLARSDAQVTSYGAAPNTAFGWGKVTASPQPITAPSAPLSGTLWGASSITWNWGVIAATSTVDAYDLVYATNTASKRFAWVSPPFTPTNLPSNTTFSLVVAGEGDGIDGPTAGPALTLVTLAIAPSSPTVYISTPTAQVSAFCPGSCAGLDFIVANSSTAPTVELSSASVSGSTQTLTIGGLALNTTYFAILEAFNSTGAVSSSSWVSFYESDPNYLPANPAPVLISTGAETFAWGHGNAPAGSTYVAQLSTAADFSGTVFAQSGTALTAAFGSLGANTSYYFQVSVLGGSFVSTGPAVTLAVAPLAGAPPFVALGSSTLTASWNGGGNAADTEYEADLSLNAGFAPVLVSSFVYTTAAAFAGLTGNTTYYARVRALARSGAGTVYAALGSTITLASPPSLLVPPFAALSTGSFVAALNPAGNSAGTTYVFQLSTSPTFATLTATKATTASTAAFSGLWSNATYYVQVAAQNAGGALTAFSVPGATATFAAAPGPIAAPFSSAAAGALTISWSSGTLGPGTTYFVEVSLLPTFAAIAASSATLSTSAVVSGLLANTTYFAQVQALSVSGDPNGAFAGLGAESTLTSAVPAASFLSVFVSTLTVSWTPLPAAPPAAACEGYRVDLSTSPTFATLSVSVSTPATAGSALVSGLFYGTTYYARVGALNWQNAPDYFVVAGSTLTLTPALSSGTIGAGGIVLTIPLASPLISLTVTIPAGAFPNGTPASAIDGFFGTPITTLAGASSNEAPIVPLGPQAGFCVSASASCLYGGGPQPAQPVVFSILYNPALLPPGYAESQIQLMRFDTVAGQWTLVQSQDDPTAHVLTGLVPHFSLFAPFFLTPALPGDVADVQIFPQPWELGAPGSPYFASTLTLASLPSGALVKFFTVGGELVWSGQASGTGLLTWDGRNRFGRSAASGTYLVVIESNSTKRLRRVVLIR